MTIDRARRITFEEVADLYNIAAGKAPPTHHPWEPRT